MQLAQAQSAREERLPLERRTDSLELEQGIGWLLRACQSYLHTLQHEFAPEQREIDILHFDAKPGLTLRDASEQKLEQSRQKRPACEQQSGGQHDEAHPPGQEAMLRAGRLLR